MKKALPYLLLLFTTNAFAQIKDLKGLVLPDVELRQLNFNGDFELRNDTSGSYFHLPLSTSLSGYKNYRYKQTFYGASLNYSSNIRNLSGVSSRNNNFSTGFSFDQTRYNKKYYFVRLNSWNRYERRLNTSRTSTTESKERRVEFSSRNNFSFGKGRLEPLDWALRAAFMNNQLVKSRAINQNLPESVILELARTMAVEDRSRFYERRFYNIRRIKAIDSVMAKNGIDINALEFYTTLSDQYFFAPNRNVFSGSRLEFTANTETNLGNSYDFFGNDVDLTKSRRIVYNFQLRYEYHLPQKIYFHHRFTASIGYGNGGLWWYRDNSNNDLILTSGFNGELRNANASYSFNWFPNTRTSFEARSNINYGIDDDKQTLTTNLSLDLNYFLNRRLSYNLRFNAGHNTWRDDANSGSTYGISFIGRFTYQIF
jgi:hypothetical protein